MLFPPAYAQTAAAAPSGATAFFVQALPLVLIFVVFYVLLIRPQQRAAKLHREKVEGAKKGDTVVTGGGLVGRVTKVEDTMVEVELAPNVRVKALKAMLSDVTSNDKSKPAND